MSVITCNLLGRFGNQCMAYCFARAYAELHNCEFQCEPWLGHLLFELNDHPITDFQLPRRSEQDLKPGEVNVNIYGYAQCDKAMIYTKAQVQKWFTWKPEIKALLDEIMPPDDSIVAHRRNGDFIGYGYPVVSRQSYFAACDYHGLEGTKLRFVSDDDPWRHDRFTGGLEFLPDFYRLTKAPTLLRGNSSFSWFAATLGNGRVFSPVVEGLEGGREHDDVSFVKGNHPRLSTLGFCTDLYLKAA